MDTIGVCEARTHLPSLLERVAQGEQITITRRLGIPVAMLVPVLGKQKADVRGMIEALLQFRKDQRLGGLSLRPLIEEGRR